MESKRFLSRRANNGYLNYLIDTPKVAGKLPLIIYVHGAGSRGNNANELEENTAVKEIIKNCRGKSVIAVPQCHKDFWFDLFSELTDFIETMISEDNIDPTRVYIIGSSMGGYTTWQMILSHTEWFAAAIPICGGAMYWAAGKLRSLPVWAFHGALDNTVNPEETVKIVKAINQSGGNAKITIFPKADHNAWVPALSMPETWEWLFSQHK